MPRGFPPIAAPRARVLILGSLPGRRSLEANEYYAQPQNVFWRIMGTLFGASPALGYPERCARLAARGVAVWDVLAEAERKGSLDAAIVRASAVCNPFAAFLAEQPQIRLIAFNGATAATLYAKRMLPELAPAAAAIERITLPSTSPAHATLRFEQKLERWSVLQGALDRRRRARRGTRAVDRSAGSAHTEASNRAPGVRDHEPR